MKKNYLPHLLLKSRKNKKNRFTILFILLSICFTPVFSQVSYSFTPAGATGSVGPTQASITAAYLSTNLNGSVVISPTATGVQTWTVPATMNYRIEARGAQGVGTYGGRGAKMAGDFNLTAGTVLKILVGQKGELSSNSSANFQYGGGGGSFVTNLSNTPYVVAGGGGGSWAISYTGASDGTIAVNGNPGINGSSAATQGAGGTGGGGGGSGNYGDGGGGLLGDGSIGNASASAAKAFVNGGTGGTYSFYGIGGFGGGAGTSSFNNTRCGGGGGYSGGGGVDGGGSGNPEGGGGGSYNNGLNQSNVSGFNQGQGMVIITSLCNFSLVSTSIGGPGPICSGNSVTLTTNAISNYSWSNGSTTSSIVVSPTVNTTYTLTAMSPLNCTTSAAITVTVNNTPTVSVVSSPSTVCAGTTVTITASGANTYTWTGGVTGSPATFTPTIPGTTVYTVTGTNACGTSTASTSFSINAIPSVTASINNPTVCTGGSVTLNGGGSVTYTWSGGYSNNVAFAPAASAAYTVTGTAANGCTASAVTSVTVFVTPNVTPVASPTAICVGASATISATGATGYTWTPGTALTNSSIVVSPPSSTTYTVLRVNGACSSTSAITLVVNPNPVMSAGATPGTICAGASVSLTAFGAITYNWLPGGFTAANVVLYPNFSTNYVVTGSNGNCTTTMTVPVVVNPSPTISVVSTPSVCSGGSAQLSASGNAATYTWSAGPPNTAAVTVTPAATTIYTITATNASNCTASQNALVVVYQTPSSTLSTSSPYICSAQSATIGAANASGVSYLWNNGATTASIIVSPTITTSYTLTATNLSSNCQGANSVTLAVYISTFSVAGPTAVCKGSSVTLTASGAAANYSWSSNAGGVTTNTASVSPAVGTVYSVAGITGSCQSTQNVSITVNPIPNVTATKAKPTVCVYDPNTTITAAGATSYSWSTGDLTATAIISPTISTTYTVTGTDLNGCSKTVTVTQFVAACVGIENYAGQSVEMNIYPNPNNGNFTISTDIAMRVNIVNTLGEVVKTIDLSTASNNEISMSNLANGIYFITSQNNGLKVNKKIVVQR